jgi:hypothetical protein
VVAHSAATPSSHQGGGIRVPRRSRRNSTRAPAPASTPPPASTTIGSAIPTGTVPVSTVAISTLSISTLSISTA